jgi:hypothetical protein
MSAQGKWRITVKTPVGDKSGVLELVVDGSKLSGSLSDAEHFAAFTDGKIAGNKLTWVATIAKPMKLNLKFSATVDADHIEGSAKHFLGSATFHGRRI